MPTNPPIFPPKITCIHFITLPKSIKGLTWGHCKVLNGARRCNAGPIKGRAFIFAN